MVMWKKALVIVLASLVGAFPVVTQVAMASPLLGSSGICVRGGKKVDTAYLQPV